MCDYVKLELACGRHVEERVETIIFETITYIINL